MAIIEGIPVLVYFYDLVIFKRCQVLKNTYNDFAV